MSDYDIENMNEMNLLLMLVNQFGLKFEVDLMFFKKELEEFKQDHYNNTRFISKSKSYSLQNSFLRSLYTKCHQSKSSSIQEKVFLTKQLLNLEYVVSDKDNKHY